MVIVTLNSGLRISETRGLQWKDVDWLAKTVTLVRGVVKQDVDDVKTEDSARTMPLADGVIAVLTVWKQVSEFTRPDDWIFASPWKLGRQPVSYSSCQDTDSGAGARFKPTVGLEVDFALWLSAFPPLLQKHEKEILLNPLGWRYVRRKVNLLQPRQRLGRPPEQNVTRAAELKAQGKSWPAIFAEMRIDGWGARYHLREAVRARHRRRRYKLCKAGQFPPAFWSKD